MNQRRYQQLIACSEDQPNNEMRCIEHLLQCQVDAMIFSTLLTARPFILQKLDQRSAANWSACLILNISLAL